MELVSFLLGGIIGFFIGVVRKPLAQVFRELGKALEQNKQITKAETKKEDLLIK